MSASDRVRPGPERWEQTMDVASLAGTSARHGLTEWLRAQGADEVVIEEMAVVVSELVTNAVRAAAPGTRPSVAAWIEDGEIHLEVGNALSQEAAARTDWDLDDPLRGGGRGLLLVRAFVDELEVEPDLSVEGIVIRCRRPLG